MEALRKKELSLDKSDWTLVKFGEVVFEPKESTKDPVADGIEHVVGLEHIEPENIHLTQSASIEESTTFTKRFSVGDVLFGRRRAYLKKAAQAAFSGICSGDITVFRAKDNLLPELLPFIVNNEKFFDYAIKHSAGGLSPRVKFKDLANYEFLLPPKDQQAKLAELLWAMDEVVENDVELLKKKVILYQSQMKKIFSVDLKKNGVLLDSLCDIITDGFHNIPKLSSNGIPLLDSTFIDDEFNIDETRAEKFISFEIHQSTKNRCKPELSDVLISSRGSIGKIAIVKPGQEFNIMANIALIRPRSGKLDSNFVKYYLSSRYAQKQLGLNSYGTSIKALYIKNIRNVLIPDFSFKMQLKISEELARSFNLQLEIKTKISNSKSLQKSLINQIF